MDGTALRISGGYELPSPPSTENSLNERYKPAIDTGWWGTAWPDPSTPLLRLVQRLVHARHRVDHLPPVFRPRYGPSEEALWGPNTITALPLSGP